MGKVIQFPEQIIRQCVGCQTNLDLIMQHNAEWEWRDIDGKRQPLCWGCCEIMDEAILEAVHEAEAYSESHSDIELMNGEQYDNNDND